MNKAPASQFFWRDWAADLEEHPLRIEGAWIRICSKLAFSEERGKLTKTVEQWARILRTPEPETREILEYIGREQIGDLEWDNDRVTVVCRRMYREYLDKVNHRLRQKRYRERRKRDGRSDGGVTSMSQAQKKEKNLPLNNPPLKEKENQEYVFEEELRNSSSQPFARSRKIGSRPAAGNGASSEPHAEYIARVKTEAQDILRGTVRRLVRGLPGPRPSAGGVQGSGLAGRQSEKPQKEHCPFPRQLAFQGPGPGTLASEPVAFIGLPHRGGAEPQGGGGVYEAKA